jgi:phosphoglycolate phosphatase-like HAD superfamily hydrolase
MSLSQRTGADDPLASWNDGPTKKSIVAFVERVTKAGGVDYVAPEERIAAFDNDGTLWSERPYPFQIAFALDQVKAMATQHPEWQNQEPFKSVLAGDLKSVIAGGHHAIIEIATATHSGMTTDEFEAQARKWLATTRHPQTDKLYTEMVFQPMLELLAYLRANGFKTFIVSGGGVEFMRAFAELTYGVPPEHVIGSSGRLKFETRDGEPALVKLREIDVVNDNIEKPAAIQKHIGSRRSAIPTVTWRCCNGRQPERAPASLCLSTTTTQRENGPMIAFRPSGNSTKHSMRPTPRVGQLSI